MIGDFPAYAIDGSQFMRQVDDYRDRLVIEKTRDMLRSYETLLQTDRQIDSKVILELWKSAYLWVVALHISMNYLRLKSW